VITLYFQLGRHLDTVATGLSLLGFAGASAVVAPFTGRAVDRFGAAPVSLTGAALAVVSTAPFVVLPVTAPVAVVQPLLAVYGAAVVLVGMPTGIAAYQTVAPDQLSDATTQVNILQRVGGSLGGAVFAVLVAARLPDADAAFQVGFLAVGVGALGALGTALLLLRATRSGG
jgi:MFS family permease